MECQTTRLFEAVQARDLQGVQNALSNGALVNMVDDHGWAPLHYSSAGGNVEICRSLMRWGGDVNATLPDFSTPLMLTVEEGHISVAKLLLESGAQVKCRDENGFTAQDRCDQRVKAELGKILQVPVSARNRNECLANGSSTCYAEAGLENQPPSKDTSSLQAVRLDKSPQQRVPSHTLLHEVQAGLPLAS